MGTFRVILISHRGNISGPNPEHENNPSYIDEAINLNFQVEVDVRSIAGDCYLGHDHAQYRVNWEYLLNSKWCHAKNIEALEIMLRMGVHCFWHQNDDTTLTSKNYIWSRPGKYLTSNSICVLPETTGGIKIGEAAGICSDFIERYKDYA